MVVSHKQFNPKKNNQYGGSRKRFASCNSTATRKTEQAGGSRKRFTSHNDNKKNPTQMGGSRKTKHAGKMAWCMRCEKNVMMVDAKEVSMKRKGGKTGKRLAGIDAAGHKVSRIISSKE